MLAVGHGRRDLARFASVSDDLRLIVAVTLFIGVAHRLFEAALAGEDKNQRVERDTQVEPERSIADMRLAADDYPSRSD